MDFLGINFYSSFYVKNSPGIQHIEDRDYIADMEVETISMTLVFSFTFSNCITNSMGFLLNHSQTVQISNSIL